MEPSDYKRLKQYLIRLIFITTTLFIIGWFSPYFVVFLFNAEPQTESTKVPENQTNSSIVENLLEELGIPAAMKILNDVTYAVYIGNEPKKAAKRLRTKLLESNIEAYTIDIDGIDSEVRIYGTKNLTYNLLFTPILPSNPKPPKQKQKRLRPQIAIIIGGLGKENHHQIVAHPYPLTIGIVPHTPYALLLAEGAALNNHEVMVDIRQNKVQYNKSSAAVPFQSGVITENRVNKSSLPDFAVNVYHSDGAPSRGSHNLAAQYRPKYSAENLLRRTQQIAIQNGMAALIIDANDERLASILEWTQTAKEKGFRLVLANEASRWEDTRGTLTKRK